MNDYTKLSKFISKVLRHQPELIGIKLDEHGWCDVDQLIGKMNQYGRHISHVVLQEIVTNDSKCRYSYNEDRTRIRANQGHTINVDLDLKQEIPPEFLYHGTVERFLKFIMQSGLDKRNRQYVHLSDSPGTAEAVGRRRGEPVILRISAGRMHNDGYTFYRSVNNVWLCDHVPKAYIEDWNSIQETLYLTSIPGMKESICEGMNTPVDDCSKDNAL